MMLEILGPDREVVLARELTKTFPKPFKGYHLVSLLSGLKKIRNRKYAARWCY